MVKVVHQIQCKVKQDLHFRTLNSYFKSESNPDLKILEIGSLYSLIPVYPGQFLLNTCLAHREKDDPNGITEYSH